MVVLWLNEKKSKNLKAFTFHVVVVALVYVYFVFVEERMKGEEWTAIFEPSWRQLRRRRRTDDDDYSDDGSFSPCIQIIVVIGAHFFPNKNWLCPLRASRCVWAHTHTHTPQAHLLHNTHILHLDISVLTNKLQKKQLNDYVIVAQRAMMMMMLSTKWWEREKWRIYQRNVYLPLSFLGAPVRRSFHRFICKFTVVAVVQARKKGLPNTSCMLCLESNKIEHNGGLVYVDFWGEQFQLFNSVDQ